uniref:Uncharacterized protein n=1 Tax=Arundo donax TaxID=35708 RepID=A0A0A9B885_ARUDO
MKIYCEKSRAFPCESTVGAMYIASCYSNVEYEYIVYLISRGNIKD